MDKYFLAPEAGVRTIVEAQPETGQHGSFWPRALGARSWGLTRAQKESLGLQGRAETQDSARLGSFWPPCPPPHGRSSLQDGQGNDLLTLTLGSHKPRQSSLPPCVPKTPGFVYWQTFPLVQVLTTGTVVNKTGYTHVSFIVRRTIYFFYTSEGTQQPCST